MLGQTLDGRDMDLLTLGADPSFSVRAPRNCFWGPKFFPYEFTLFLMVNKEYVIWGPR